MAEKKPLSIFDLDGVGEATGKKLIERGYDTVEGLANANPKLLSSEVDMSEPTARKLINLARDKCDMGFDTAIAVEEKRMKTKKISLGFKEVDELLGGGFETGSITEVFAEFGAGKTQIAHLLAAKSLIQYPKGYVFYIDTEGSFRPNRVRDFFKGMKVSEEDQNKAMKRLLVARATSSDQQKFLAGKAQKMVDEEKIDIKLLIIDSLTAHFRAEYIGRGTLNERQQSLNAHMHQLARIADSKNIVVYVTNQVMADPSQLFGDPTKAIGGHIVGHASKTRLYLRKGAKGSRVLKLIDSPDLPDGEIAFKIVTGGMESI